MTSLLYEARQTVRAIGKQPFFTAVAVVTLGLGIGANTAIFSVVDTVLLDRVPYPVEEPENVMVLTEKSRSWDAMSVAYPNFKDWQRLNRSLQIGICIVDVEGDEENFVDETSVWLLVKARCWAMIGRR